MEFPIIIQKTDIKFFILGEKPKAKRSSERSDYKELSLLVHSSSVNLEIIGSYLNEIRPYFPEDNSEHQKIEYKVTKSLTEKEKILSVKGRKQSVFSSRQVAYTFCWVGNAKRRELDIVERTFDTHLDAIAENINNGYIAELEMDLSQILSLCYLFEKKNNRREKNSDPLNFLADLIRDSSPFDMFSLVGIISAITAIIITVLPLI